MVFYKENTNEPKDDEHKKDAHRKMKAAKLINVYSISVSNSNEEAVNMIRKCRYVPINRFFKAECFSNNNYQPRRGGRFCEGVTFGEFDRLPP